MRGLYVETRIRSAIDDVWRRAIDPVEHVRWDLRFTSIVPDEIDSAGHESFTYALRLPGRTIRGRGVSVGERLRPDGTRTSALRFGTDDPVSPLRDGSGYWRFVPTDDGVRFITGYDYTPGWGRLGAAIDPHVLRPFVGWLTARSFDALRISIDHDLAPERVHRRGAADLLARAAVLIAVTVTAGRRSPVSGVTAAALAIAAVSLVPAPDDVPQARRCLRRPPDVAAARAPRTLSDLASPR